MLGLTPAVWITEGDRPEAGCGIEQPGDRLPVGDVTVDGRGRYSQVLQRGGRGIKPVLPDIAQDDCVVPADDFGRRQTHATRSARDYRHLTHTWTVSGRLP
jgi:hypothetical protein